jgi:hypothetical protein
MPNKTVYGTGLEITFISSGNFKNLVAKLVLNVLVPMCFLGGKRQSLGGICENRHRIFRALRNTAH